MLNNLKIFKNKILISSSKASKHFSVFNKLKEYLKSGVQSTYTIFGSQIDPDKIKVEYEETIEEPKSKKSKKGDAKSVDEVKKQGISYEEMSNEMIKFERNITLIRKEEKERELIDAMIAEIQKEDTTQHIKKTSKSRFKTIWEKLDYYEATAEGKIRLPYVYEQDAKTPKEFSNMSEYIQWKDEKAKEVKQQIFEKLTPMEFYISQGKGTERPYTGDYWDTNQVGVYCCKICTQRLFSSTHKYNAKGIGHATFWNFLPGTLNFYDDHLDFPTPTQSLYKIKFANSKPKKRITCSNCDSHLGHVFEDGPAPFFKRLNINSAVITFLDIGWFTSPDEIRRKKELNILLQEQETIERQNTIIQRMKESFPGVFEFVDKNIVDFEKNINYEKISNNLKVREESKLNENKNI